ncbi:MAG: thioredoxin-disulfide reductase [Kiritimatiellae bacterium]|jgi:thioredoxin reductase (NADPH)|nr:thioredoxin-disulfide reductase [Kiritimatiellia bacterium]MDD2349658.1 thioredoxin-disulfide reductase [Kiritimatiellia bacterium]MDD3584806.1 thioredoxin-disulfide reductase [Kiritimatiellia bacterium]HHU15936.1 thioredoxin-disulfide reductase [Lentisphaerota bacterium]
MENVVIIGSGPAGLTAAIYAARASLNPIVIEGMQPGGQLTQTSDVENFPGFEDPITGTELVTAMRKQAERLGVRYMMDEVTGCDFSGETKKLSLMVGDMLETRTVIIATGASARYLGLDSEQKLIGKGVSACATCDGAFFKGRPVAVVGGGDTAMEEALYLSRIASHVTVIHRRDEFRASKIMADRVLAAPAIDVRWDSVVEEVLDVAKGEVTGLRLRNVKTQAIDDLPVEGVFMAIGHIPNTAAFDGQLERDDEGYIVTENTRTSVPGVFAAGDVQDRHYKQAVTAAGTGCIAALEAERFLVTHG